MVVESPTERGYTFMMLVPTLEPRFVEFMHSYWEDEKKLPTQKHMLTTFCTFVETLRSPRIQWLMNRYDTADVVFYLIVIIFLSRTVFPEDRRILGVTINENLGDILIEYFQLLELEIDKETLRDLRLIDDFENRFKDFMLLVRTAIDGTESVDAIKDWLYDGE